MNRRFCFLIIAILFIFSCKEIKEKNINCINVNIEDCIKKDPEIVKLSEYAKNINYVQLETNDSCLIRNIRDVKLLNNVFYINNDFKEIILFDNTGKYLRKIGRIGNGPGEVIQINAFSLLNDNTIVVFDNMTSTIFFYDLAGNFKNQKRIDFYPDNMGVMQNEYLVFSNIRDRYNKSNNYSLTVLNKDLSQNKQFLNKEWEAKYNSSEMPLFRCNFYNVRDTFSYWETYYDTIWRVTSNMVKPMYFLDLGDEKYPFDVRSNFVKFKKYREDYSIIQDIVETKKYIFIGVAHKKRFVTILYDKIKNSIKNVAYPHINDIDEGENFWPDKNGRLNDSLVYKVFYPYEIKRDLKREDLIIKKDFTDKKKTYLQLIESAKIVDNPSIMVVELK